MKLKKISLKKQQMKIIITSEEKMNRKEQEPAIIVWELTKVLILLEWMSMIMLKKSSDCIRNSDDKFKLINKCINYK